MLDQALFALLHVLVFVYWLGGDLGAFYTSRYLTRPGVSTDRRLLAAKIVGDVDMAPRTSLILALPTGLALAEVRGWISLGWLMVTIIAIAALGWLVLAWALHLAHGAGAAWMKALDLVLRWVLLASLIVWALAAYAGAADLPHFLAAKLLILAGCIGLGLAIRRVLHPLGPALAGLAGSEAASAETSLARTLAQARPLVVAIWALLLLAALLGLWTPV